MTFQLALSAVVANVKNKLKLSNRMSVANSGDFFWTNQVLLFQYHKAMLL